MSREHDITLRQHPNGEWSVRDGDAAIPRLYPTAQAAIAALTASPQAAPTMEDALAAGDGTLHGAIDYWQGRALKAEAALASPQVQGGEVTTKLREILDERVEELAQRLVASGPKAAHVSASECHEITDAILDARAALASGPSGVDGVVVPRELPTAGIAVVLDYINENIGRITPTKMWRLLLEKIEVRP
jgi:hypothetical protein